MTLSDHLRPETVLLDLTARTKAEVLKSLAAHAAEAIGRDPSEIARALTERETLGSTGVGSGVALPHAAIPRLAEPIALFARLARPIDWEAIDDRPIDLVVAVLSPTEWPGTSPNLLAKFARLMRGEDTRARLRACSDIDRLLTIVAEADE
jgi:PTS system nitrogen regulatory IIA component